MFLLYKFVIYIYIVIYRYIRFYITYILHSVTFRVTRTGSLWPLQEAAKESIKSCTSAKKVRAVRVGQSGRRSRPATIFLPSLPLLSLIITILEKTVIHFYTIYIYTGWWLGTMEFYDFPYIGNNHHPTWRSHIFRGVGIPPTSHLSLPS